LILSFTIPSVEHVIKSETLHPLQVETWEIAGLRQRFAKCGLTAAAWTFDKPRLAAAQNMLEIDEHSPLNHVASLCKEIGEGGRPIRVDEQARVNRRQVWIVRDHRLLVRSYSLSGCRTEDSARTVSAMRRI